MTVTTKTTKKTTEARKTRATKRQMLRMQGALSAALYTVEAYDLEEGIVYPRDVQAALSAARSALLRLERVLDSHLESE